MNSIKLNETPRRTSRNFNINNIKLDNIDIPDKLNKFNGLTILNDTSKITIEELERSNLDLTYGVGILNKNSNKNLRISIDSKQNKELVLDFRLDKQNKNLVDNIEIIANEASKVTIIIKYSCRGELCSPAQMYHNATIKLNAKKNSNINVIVVNLLNQESNNFVSIENNLEENANVNYTIVDFGGKNSISNYYSNILGDYSSNNLSTIYLGTNEQLFDLNYIAELRGKKTNINIEVQGALGNSSKKHFKGTIDFKKGSKKAKGNENESCMLLSDKAKSIALPMLLCSEEDVEGNHSSSAGKIGNKELFYIMSRGLSEKEAMKLMVRAKFNSILESIKNEELKNEILYYIENKL
ncbi:MAG: SufD family Fe-S cluster assembly protein [Clostridia bacterium]|nr:SufD family Fe-S cluster assembly protein [Clostridia bacterium]